MEFDNSFEVPLPPAQVLQSSATAIRTLIGQLSRDPKASANGGT